MMRTMLACAAALAVLAAPAQAEARYDRKLEDAVKARIAETIGDIRGSFDYGAAAEFVQPDPLVTGSVPAARPERRIDRDGVRQGRLTLAVDRKFARHVF